MANLTWLDDRAQQSLPERELLLATVQALPPGAQIVELGSADGGTSLLLAGAGRARGARVASVDRLDNPGRAQRYAEHGIEALRGDTSAPAGYWADGRRVDLLLVDADHSWFGVRADFEAWLPFLAPQAIVLFHDVSPVCPGEFVYVWERVFQQELVQVRGAGTLLGGRLATAAPARRRTLTSDGARMLHRLLDADLAAWPVLLHDLPAPPAAPRGAVPAGDPALAAAIRAAFGLDPDADGRPAARLVIEEPAAAAIARLARAGCPVDDLVVAATLFRQEFATLLFRTRDPRFLELFADETRPAVRAWIDALRPEARTALARGGVAGRVRLFDFVDPAKLYALARSFEDAAGHADENAATCVSGASRVLPVTLH